VDGAVHMRFSGKVDDGARLVSVQQWDYPCRFADVDLRKDMPIIPRKRCEVLQIACIGKLVKIDD
jgi:hypothetical protein